MLLIEEFISDEQVAELKALLAKARYVDGSISAGRAARQVKNNLQCHPLDPHYAEANEFVRLAITRCDELQSYALPNKVTPVTFSRYGAGMAYGTHLDAAVMPLPNALLRVDVSFTLFLTPPAEYEGGELCIETGGTRRLIKADAGDLFAYASGVSHQVNEVTGGCREVAVGWLQSLVEDPQRRQILFDIYTVRNHILDSIGKTEEYDLLQKSYVNLQRMWVKP